MVLVLHVCVSRNTTEFCRSNSAKLTAAQDHVTFDLGIIVKHIQQGHIDSVLKTYTLLMDGPVTASTLRCFWSHKEVSHATTYYTALK